MKKLFTTLMGASALSLALVSPAAHAAPPPDVSNSFFLNLAFGDGLEQFAYFSDSFDTAGSTFVDDYFFGAPPPNADVAFTVSADDFVTGSPDVVFTGFSLQPYQPGEPVTDIPLTSIATDFLISGSTIDPIDSGIYVLEISGTALADGASYSGLLTATVPTPPPVPEPETWALMLAGLVALGAAAQRKRLAP